MTRIRRIGRAISWAILGGLGLAGPVRAHGGGDLGPDDLWTAWHLSPDIVIPALLFAIVYSRGMIRRSGVASPVSRWRHVSFFAGALAVFLALQSPIDPFAERSFWIHQVQHLLLRMLGPMLLALSAPEGILVAGLPRSVRRMVLHPLAQSRTMRGLAVFLRNGWVVFVLFIASLYVWEVPAIHDLALVIPWLHYLMHVTMLMGGLLFFWRIFERSGPPKGLRHGIRVAMLMGSIGLSILLGSATTLKEHVLYRAYDIDGRLFTASPLNDEQGGGFIIWISGPMMALVAMLIVITAWNRHEVTRYDRRRAMPFSNSAALEFPETAEELWIKVERPNRHLSWALSAVPTAIFMLVMGLAVLAHAQ